MKFHHHGDKTIKFEIDGYHFVVEPGQEVHLDARYAYVPGARGLPLAKGDSPRPDAGTAPDPTRVRRAPMKLPEGVENGPSQDGPSQGGPDEDDAEEREPEPEPEPTGDDAADPEGDAVAKTLAQLKDAGVTLPSQTPRRGRRQG